MTVEVKKDWTSAAYLEEFPEQSFSLKRTRQHGLGLQAGSRKNPQGS